MRSRRGSLIDARGAGLRHDRGDGRCRGGGRRRRSSLLWLDSVSEVEGQVRPETTKKQMCTYLSGTTLFRQSVFPGFCLRQSVFPVTVVGLAGDDQRTCARGPTQARRVRCRRRLVDARQRARFQRTPAPPRGRWCTRRSRTRRSLVPDVGRSPPHTGRRGRPHAAASGHRCCSKLRRRGGALPHIRAA